MILMLIPLGVLIAFVVEKLIADAAEDLKIKQKSALKPGERFVSHTIRTDFFDEQETQP